jgi:hypothetical protein
MLQVIISSDIENRKKKRIDVLSQYPDEVIRLSDVEISFSDLENYIFPSLFSEQKPVVHARYLLEEYSNEITKELLSKLVNSPTFFLLEEKALGAQAIKMIEKEGGLIHNEKSKSQIINKSNIFLVTNAITATNKKDRWMAYQNAKQEHAPEALIGILYWKLRGLIEKSPTKAGPFRTFYTNLMNAQKKSWQTGFSLDLAIEKTILEQ